uniref:Uncharacterized protein n=1 Tax=Rhipicephalus pulchellus TaxID=72859 RepID=L7LZE9_RHIPC
MNVVMLLVRRWVRRGAGLHRSEGSRTEVATFEVNVVASVAVGVRTFSSAAGRNGSEGEAVLERGVCSPQDATGHGGRGGRCGMLPGGGAGGHSG